MQSGVANGLRSPARFIPQLESLRGWAILLVVTFHYFGILSSASSAGLSAQAPFWLRLAAAGNTGVSLFFVLSGFLLIQPFILAFRGEARISIRSFYLARILRIVPLYYIAVLVAWLVSGNTNSALQAALFIPVGFSIFPFSVPWWSLCTEVQFYLLLPWIMLALTWRLGRWLMVAGVLLWLTLHSIYFVAPELILKGNKLSINGSIFGRGTAFLFGGLAAWLYLSPIYMRITRRAVLFWGLSLAAAAALLLLLQWYGLIGQKQALKAFPFYHDVEALLWSVVLLACLRLSGWLKIIFINPLMSHFGKISYSLYLVHVPIQFYLLYPLVMKGAAATSSHILWLTIFGSFLLSWLAAVFCYRFIEMPCLKLKAHLPVISDKFRAGLARA
jgi:peptidoglycan/LPS O-acetylase OafA/YrhL